MVIGYLALVAASVSASTAEQHKPYPCYWVTGRLAYSNGTPSLRIWPRNSHRLLGVLNRKSQADTDDALPATIKRLEPSFDRRIWGNFRVCPLAPERAGWMRMVYMTATAKLKVVPYR